jgi:hypothetical protein
MKSKVINVSVHHKKAEDHMDKAKKHHETAAMHHKKAKEYMEMIKHEKKEKKLIGKLSKMHKKY